MAAPTSSATAVSIVPVVSTAAARPPSPLADRVAQANITNQSNWYYRGVLAALATLEAGAGAIIGWGVDGGNSSEAHTGLYIGLAAGITAGIITIGYIIRHNHREDRISPY